MGRLTCTTYSHHKVGNTLAWCTATKLTKSLSTSQPSVLFYILTNQVCVPYLKHQESGNSPYGNRHMATTQYVRTGQVINYDVHKLTEDSSQQWSVSWDQFLSVYKLFKLIHSISTPIWGIFHYYKASCSHTP